MLIKVLICQLNLLLFCGGNMALIGLFKRKKEPEIKITEPLKLQPLTITQTQPAERHIDDLEIPSPSIPEEMKSAEAIAESEKAAMPLFPEIPSLPEEKKTVIEEKEKEAEIEVPEELPELEEFPKELREMKEGSVSVFAPEIEEKKHVFVSLDDYKNVLERLTEMRSGALRFSELSIKLSDIKKSKDGFYERFRNVLEDIERKLLYVDKNLFGGIR